MKFAEHLSAQLTPEWRVQYLQYEEMKKFLYAAEEKAPPKEEVNEDVLRRHFAKYEEGFFMFSDKELAKIDTFYAEKLAEATRKFNELKVEIAHISGNAVLGDGVSSLEAMDDEMANGSATQPKTKVRRRKSIIGKNSRKLKDLKFAVTEFYLSLILIQNFQQLNFTGFRKILKKHDKMFQTTSGVEYRIAKVEAAPFYVNKQICEIITETENMYINELENGNRGKAMKRLRVPPLSEKKKHWSWFLWGLFTGIFLVLFIISLITWYLRYSNSDWIPALRMYRGVLLVIVMVALLGVNSYGWSKAGVNHILIFELNPRDHLSYIDLLKLASFFGVLWCLSTLGFLYSSEFYLPAFAHPLALACFMLAFLLNPTKTFHHSARYWLLKILFRILTAPFHPVFFADFWLADQLNSLVVPLRDFQYLVCFYSYDWYNKPENRQCTNPQLGIQTVIAILPAWFRLAQCLRRYRDTRHAWPHLVNAGKYSTSILVTIVSTFAAIDKIKSGRSQSGFLFYLWIVTLLIGTFYTLFWDIRMDWGLLDKNWGENFLLREQIVYDSKAFYYFAAIADVVFRFLWTLSVSVGEAGLINSELFVFFVASCEVFRRFVWNFFRLENEHLNNCGQFRAVRDISIKPILPEKSEEMTLEQLMDHEDGPLPKKRVVRLLLEEGNSKTQSKVRREKKISFFKL